LILWILASVIPAGVSSESPHLNRPNTLLPGLILLQAMGLFMLFKCTSQLQNSFFKLGTYTFILAIIGISFVWFLHSYFIRFPYAQSKLFQYGATQALSYANENQNKYQKIIISNRDTLLDGYAYYLFTTKYDPALYQKHGGTHSAFFTDTHLIGKFDFRDPNLYEPKRDVDQLPQANNVLYITNPSELSPQIMKNEKVHLIKTYYFLDGSDSLWLLEGTI